MYQKGSLGARLVAFIIDEIISAFVPSFIFALLGLVGLKISPFDQIIIWIVAIFYWPLMTWKYGATLGKRWLKLRVVDSHPNGSIGLGKALLREWLGKLISGIAFSLGYVWALIDKRNQSWHDKIAGTYVLSVDLQGNLIPIQEETPVSAGRKVLFWVLLVVGLLQFLVLPGFMLAYLFFARPVEIRGDAMNPSYRNGQYWFTNPGAYRGTDPQRGDVIVFNSPKTPDLQFISRVIGLPGERLKISRGKVYVNGAPLDESSYLSNDTYTGPESFLPENKEIAIPDGQFFVLGDNRPHSSDSRDFGPVPKDKITGKASMCYWMCSQ